MSTQYANELEQWFRSLPQLVQETLHEPFDWINSVLRDISGNPHDLIEAGAQYVALGEAVRTVGQQQLSGRIALAVHWQGKAHSAFDQRMGTFEDQLARLGEAISHMNEVLHAAAKATVDGANMIVDIVKSLIMFALGQIAVNVALAVVTLGTSLAAGVAMVLARAASALAKVTRVVEKLAQILGKVSTVLEKLQKVLEAVTKLLQKIEASLKNAKNLVKEAQGIKGKLPAYAKYSLKNAAVSEGIKLGTLGAVDPPGAVGSAIQAGSDYVDGWKDASEAQKAAAPDSNP